ncbi:MAG TPA: hypothetical protein PKC13_24015, partial [Blastocatellia bacterium]|nr:hypothetical protein [Blastocatellia bacterium]
MKTRLQKIHCLFLLMLCVALAVAVPQSASAQGKSRDKDGREVYTGTIYYFGGTRGSVTTTFTLNIDSLSSDAEVQRLLGELQRGGQ